MSSFPKSQSAWSTSTPKSKSRRSKNKTKVNLCTSTTKHIKKDCFKSTGHDQVKEFILYKDVTRVAIISRIIVLCLECLALESIPVHENDGFKLKTEEDGRTILDSLIDTFLRGFRNWDGQYFLHIAMYGYTEENIMAFFPLFPTIVGILSKLLYFIFPIMTFSSTVMLVSYFLNVYFFVQAALTLFRLVPYYDRGLQHLSAMVVMLFCYNPASIFFSAAYSESLFAMLTFKVLLALHEKNPRAALMYASLSAVCRSNGLLNLGFCFAFALRNTFQAEAESCNNKNNDSCNRYRVLLTHLTSIGYELLKCVAGLLPFIGFQFFCRVRFCDSEYLLPSKIPGYCSGAQLPYQYIQSANWNVGFLRYFQMKQLPNFILAAPVLCSLGYHCFPRFLKYVVCILKDKNLACIPSAAVAGHGVFLTVFCFTCMHVQVSTRLILSSCPYLYIFIAKSLRTETYHSRNGLNDSLKYSLMIYGWFFLYFVVGSVLFSTGYPWT